MTCWHFAAKAINGPTQAALRTVVWLVSEHLMCTWTLESLRFHVAAEAQLDSQQEFDHAESFNFMASVFQPYWPTWACLAVRACLHDS